MKIDIDELRKISIFNSFSLMALGTARPDDCGTGHCAG